MDDMGIRARCIIIVVLFIWTMDDLNHYFNIYGYNFSSYTTAIIKYILPKSDDMNYRVQYGVIR